MRHSRGFTLVELIVVIVIVVAVTIILLSPRGRSRSSAKIGNCASNLRQIGLAIEQYSMDFNQGYPKTASPGNVGIGASSLALLGTTNEPIIVNLKIFVCPSSGDIADKYSETWTEFSSAKSISYGYDPGHSPADGTDVIVSADYSPDGKNSSNHGPNASQNLLFLGDWHVEFKTTPNCGVDDNNIYLDDAPDLPRAKDSIVVR